MFKSIRSIGAKIKDWYISAHQVIHKILEITTIITIIGLIILIYDTWDKSQTNTSYKDTIFHEILFARNKLDYTLYQRLNNVTNRPTFSLSDNAFIATAFNDDAQTKNNLLSLRESLLSAQKSAEELNLLPNNKSNSSIIERRKNDIKRAINYADSIGPVLAQKLDKTWDIPTKTLNIPETIKWLENKGMIYSGATDEVTFSNSNK